MVRSLHHAHLMHMARLHAYSNRHRNRLSRQAPSGIRNKGDALGSGPTGAGLLY
jgi:hypothetical protein